MIRKITLSFCTFWSGIAPGTHPILAMLIKLELLTEHADAGEGRRIQRGTPGVLALAERFEVVRRRRADRLAEYWEQVVSILESALRGAREQAQTSRAHSERLRNIKARAA